MVSFNKKFIDEFENKSYKEKEQFLRKRQIDLAFNFDHVLDKEERKNNIN